MGQAELGSDPMRAFVRFGDLPPRANRFADGGDIVAVKFIPLEGIYRTNSLSIHPEKMS